MSNLPASILNALRTVLPNPDTFYPLHEPEFSLETWNLLKECLDSGWVSSVGKYVDQFEEQFCDITGAQYAIATTNGTAALHLALHLAKVQRDDEVITPTLTFVATTNAISYCGAVPHFVDSDPITLGVCPDKLSDYLNQIAVMRNGICYNKKTNRNITALMVVHIFGRPAQIKKLRVLADKWNLELIEDAAEALGSEESSVFIGSNSKFAAFSFNGNKIITTGGGGVLATSDFSVWKRAKHLSTTAKQQHAWEYSHDEIGFNYRMPNINAAMGCAQLNCLKDFLNRKRELSNHYLSAFQKVKGIQFIQEAPNTKINYWLNILQLNKPNLELRNEILEVTNKSNIMTRPIWNLMHNLPMYSSSPRMHDLSTASNLFASIINIPSSPSLISSRLN
ncbi:LegC family aminotransferase [Terasakiella sp. SH-1]|uniref:LegC family aminotransferase n=1 Tax=Terasakiella sp. SH-1 TaxID=2560057 RepID=UPI00107357E0|nr:LegC family aminotransferase [Terasakiella sp. SH-1]